jgi:hypothetical protein
MKNILKILLPLLHVSPPILSHLQGAHSFWSNLFKPNLWMPRIVSQQKVYSCAPSADRTPTVTITLCTFCWPNTYCHYYAVHLLLTEHLLSLLRCAPSTDRTPTVTIPGFSIHDVSVNRFDQELWAPWRWRRIGAETCRSGINILNIFAY